MAGNSNNHDGIWQISRRSPELASVRSTVATVRDGELTVRDKPMAKTIQNETVGRDLKTMD